MSLVQIPPLDKRKHLSSSCQGAAVIPADIPEMTWVMGAAGSGPHGRILECNLQPITVTSPLTMASYMSPLGHPLVASGCCLAGGWTMSHSALLALMYNPQYVLFSFSYSPFLVSPWVTGIWTWDASSLMPQSLSFSLSLYIPDATLCLTDPPVSTQPPWGHFHIHCFYTFKHCRAGLLRQLIRKDVTVSYLWLRSHSLRAWLSHLMIHSSSFVTICLHIAGTAITICLKKAKINNKFKNNLMIEYVLSFSRKCMRLNHTMGSFLKSKTSLGKMSFFCWETFTCVCSPCLDGAAFEIMRSS